jgi:hypothetical protein
MTMSRSGIGLPMLARVEAFLSTSKISSEGFITSHLEFQKPSVKSEFSCSCLWGIGSFKSKPKISRGCGGLNMLETCFRDGGRKEHAYMGVIRDPCTIARVGNRIRGVGWGFIRNRWLYEGRRTTDRAVYISKKIIGNEKGVDHCLPVGIIRG